MFVAVASLLVGIVIGAAVSNNSQSVREYEMKAKIETLEASVEQARYRIKYLESRHGRKPR